MAWSFFINNNALIGEPKSKKHEFRIYYKTNIRWYDCGKWGNPYQLNSDVSLINQLGYYIISGGKGSDQWSQCSLDEHWTIKVTNIFGRSAYRIYSYCKHCYDDVVDESDMQRKTNGKCCLWKCCSVLVGDFIYTRSFQMMTDLDSMRIKINV